MKPVETSSIVGTGPSAGAVTISSRGERIDIPFLVDGLLGSGGTENHLATLVSRLNQDLFRAFVCAFRDARRFLDDALASIQGTLPGNR